MYRIKKGYKACYIKKEEYDYDEYAKRNHGSSGFSETEQKRRYLAQVISTQQETQDLQFRKIHQKLEDEREILLKERNDLAWD